MDADRRTFLRLSLAVGGLATAGAGAWCVWRRPAEQAGVLPFAVWREIRETIRNSPDHFAREAATFTADTPLDAIVGFVRDRIATVPGAENQPLAVDGVRWGPRATLRAGSATPREKVELLVHLLGRAGWTADVLIGDGLTPEQSRLELTRGGVPMFAPAQDERRLGRWRERLGPPLAPEQPPVIDDDRASAVLAQRLLPHLQADARPVRFDWRWSRTPVVRARRGDDDVLVNLFAPSPEPGTAAVDPTRLRPAPPVGDVPDVAVRLDAVLATPDRRRQTLVEGTWSLDDVIGRQIRVEMRPGLDMAAIAHARFQDAHVFAPALRLQALDLDSAAAREHSVVGDLITRDGARLGASPSGGVTLDGREVLAGASSADVAAVATLAIAVDASFAPHIRVDGWARDASGALVEGLDASAFAITDEGEAVGFVLRGSDASPRIALLVDQSGSMPTEYRGDAMDALTAGIRAGIRARYPRAEISAHRTDSSLWSWLARAAASDAHLIVYATDGHVDDQPTEAIRQALAAGPPAVIVDVRNYPPTHFWHQRSFRPLAEATHGTVVPVSEPARIHEAILRYLTENLPELPPYRFEYTMPAATAGERRVTLRTRDGRLEASGTYTVPESPAMAPELCGLSLTVRIGRTSVARTLAGCDPQQDARTPVTRAMIDETLGACFGTHVLSFEPGAPTLAAWLDDWVSAKLAMEPLATAAAAGDVDGVAAAIDEGLALLPADLVLHAAPALPRAEGRAVTFDLAPRVTLAQSYPALGTDRLVTRATVLPFMRCATAADDPQQAFGTTLASTARLAVAEAHLHDTSAATVLDGISLAPLRDIVNDREVPIEARNALRALAREAPGRRVFVGPSAGLPAALWGVDAVTGSVIGLRPYASGDGQSDLQYPRPVRPTDRVIVVNASLPSTPLPPVGAFSPSHDDAAARDAARINTPPGPPAPTTNEPRAAEVAEAGAALACQVMAAPVTGVFSESAESAATLARLLGLLSAVSPAFCPTAEVPGEQGGD